MRTIHLSVEGMHCRRCVRQATALLRDVPGVATVTADSTASRITLTGDITDHAALEALAGTTFTVHVTESTPLPAHSPPTTPTTPAASTATTGE